MTYRRLVAFALLVFAVAACGQREGAHMPVAAPVAQVTATRSPAPVEQPTTVASEAPPAPAGTEAQVAQADDAHDEPHPEPASQDTPAEDDGRDDDINTDAAAGTRTADAANEAPSPAPTEQTEQPEPDYGAPLWDRHFRSQRVTDNGQERELVAGTHLDVSFAKNRPKDGISADNLDWHAGCNYYGQGVRVEQHLLNYAPGGMATSAGCNTELEGQDDWVYEFFRSNPRWRLEGDTLTLVQGDVTIELRERTPRD